MENKKSRLWSHIEDFIIACCYHLEELKFILFLPLAFSILYISYGTFITVSKPILIREVLGSRQNERKAKTWYDTTEYDRNK